MITQHFLVNHHQHVGQQHRLVDCSVMHQNTNSYQSGLTASDLQQTMLFNVCICTSKTLLTMSKSKCNIYCKNNWPVHDSEAVQVQGRGCHPRGQARGFECWVHIWQSPLKLQGGLENLQCFLCIQPAAAAPNCKKIQYAHTTEKWRIKGNFTTPCLACLTI